MAQAVHLSKGPYAQLRNDVDSISRKYANIGTDGTEYNNSDTASESVSRSDNSHKCAKCERFFPFHGLAFHEGTCLGTDVSEVHAERSAQYSGPPELEGDPTDLAGDTEIAGDYSDIGGSKRRDEADSDRDRYVFLTFYLRGLDVNYKIPVSTMSYTVVHPPVTNALLTSYRMLG